MTVKNALEASLNTRSSHQLNDLLDTALAKSDLSLTNKVLAAFQATGRAALIEATELDTTSEACATLTRRVKSQALGCK